MVLNFEHINKALCKEPLLQYPNSEKLYTLFTDANHYAYSGILHQAVGSLEDLRPIAYTSDSFPYMQQRWSVTEKEAFVVYQSVLKFDLYLRVAKCILCCIHKPLESFLSNSVKIPISIGGLWNWQTTT